jgi:hypothetical protein
MCDHKKAYILGSGSARLYAASRYLTVAPTLARSYLRGILFYFLFLFYYSAN